MALGMIMLTLRLARREVSNPLLPSSNRSGKLPEDHAHADVGANIAVSDLQESQFRAPLLQSIMLQLILASFS